jgi:single-strand DNA-binding protein
VGSSNVLAGMEPASPALGPVRPQRCPDPLPASVLVHAAWARNRTRAKEGAMDLNLVAITGRLAADPDLHSTGNGTDVTTLRIAVGRMKRQGEQRPGADFVDVVVWGEQAKHAGRYLAKGRRVAIKGRLQQRTWTTPDGAKRSRLQVVADQVQFLDYKDRTGDDTGQVPDEPAPETAPEAAADTLAEEAAPETSAPPAGDASRRAPRRRKAATK